MYQISTNDDLKRGNRVMLAFSCVFLAASFVLTPVYGSLGLIFANMINMLARIVRRFVLNFAVGYTWKKSVCVY